MSTDLTTYFDERDADLIARFTTFMETVVTNAKTDYVRKMAYTRYETTMDQLPEKQAEISSELESLFQDNKFQFEEHRIADAFYGLNLMRQRILELTYIHQMSAQEIADHLNCSLKFVYNQRAVAIRKLRDLLLKGGDRDE